MKFFTLILVLIGVALSGVSCTKVIHEARGERGRTIVAQG